MLVCTERFLSPCSALLQIDVEGDELEVLQGVKQWRAVHQVVAEVHKVEGRVQAVQALLESHGFLVTVHAGCAPNTAMLYAAKQDRLLNL